MPTVLVVDDQPEVLSVARRALTSAGFQVFAANNGAEALAHLQARGVDVLLTDIDMPGMSGPQLIVEVRKIYPEVRPCFMTGSGIVPPDGIPLLRKPFRAGNLIQFVQTVLEAEPQPKGPSPAELYREMLAAREHWLECIAELRRLASEVPSGVPYPDGNLRIEQAGRQRAAAYAAYRAALARYERGAGDNPKFSGEGSEP